MKLKDRLRSYSDYANRLTYDQIIELMIEKAKEGNMEIYIDADEVLYDDIQKLKIEEDLSVILLEGEGYADGGCWKIQW